MAIGDTSIIKDANGVSITVKDIASDCLIEQTDGTYHRENYRTEASEVFKNGIALDKLTYTTFFGAKLSGDVVVTTNDYSIPWAVAYPNMSSSTDFAQLASGKIKVLKTGYYFINLNVHISDMTTNNNVWFNIKKTYGNTVEYVAANMSTKMWTEAQGSVCVFTHLKAGDIIEGIAARGDGANMRIAVTKTHMLLVPVYIP
ncbi:hypothetical protein [Eubacterium callanderi]|uniref:hypothetical protein n=1 Tax=Eubacterium callanderi TaxID=53442 RepID=UPI001AA0F101|nr:hypothetical protein [Eubacterium callanderi]MBO1702217.1 hypothetical protein [Eubacterium callanderi]